MTQPDGDVDGDSIANGVDACPEARGEPNPDQEWNGCPTKVGGIGGTEIRIMEQPQFAPASSTPKISDRAMLDQIAAILKERPDIKKVIVAGHAAAGEANAASVSERRAERVVDELVKRGVDASRLEARGFGVDRPIASNVTQEGRAQNRRVEFEIVELSP